MSELSIRPVPTLWELPTSATTVPVALHADETHLWFTDLDRQIQDETIDFLLTLLDDSERDRALRFRRAELTSRFVMAHGRLRQVLGRYLGIAPEQVRFCHGDRGKPALAPQPMLHFPAQASGQLSQNAQPLQFNMSHSDRYGLIAVSHSPVGVDLEAVKSFPSASSLAKRFFSAKEFETLQLLHDSEAESVLEKGEGLDRLDRSIAFLRHWVCKEAYVKATGNGLADQLQQVIVDFSSGARFEALPVGAEGWQVLELTPSPDTVAAIVLPQDAPPRCRYWQIP
jgi:4'-phosphopantetheinyl transferase